MAEILIRARDNDGPSAYRVGDPVVVRPGGWPWSASERDTSEFWLIRLPGVDVADLEYLTEPWETVRAPQDVVIHRHEDGEIAAVVDRDQIGPRAHQLVIPPVIQDALRIGPVSSPPGWQSWVRRRPG
jgi:hypothetical protein